MHSKCFNFCSEYDMGCEISNQLVLQVILVTYATIDRESRSAEGKDYAMKTLQSMWNGRHFANKTHLAQSQFRQFAARQISVKACFLGDRRTKERNLRKFEPGRESKMQLDSQRISEGTCRQHECLAEDLT